VWCAICAGGVAICACGVRSVMWCAICANEMRSGHRPPDHENPATGATETRPPGDGDPATRKKVCCCRGGRQNRRQINCVPTTRPRKPSHCGATETRPPGDGDPATRKKLCGCRGTRQNRKKFHEPANDGRITRIIKDVFGFILFFKSISFLSRGFGATKKMYFPGSHESSQPARFLKFYFC
jgi:hypothetical protein